jgi:membrane-anchored mycosin MYCP
MFNGHRQGAGKASLALARIAAAFGAFALFGGLLVPPAAVADATRDREYWLAEYGIAEAWKVSQGEGVKVAVIDSGVDASHPDLAGAVVGGTDVSGAGSANGQQGIGQTPEHGTLVATLLAGRGHPAPEPPAPAPTAGETAAPDAGAEAPPEASPVPDAGPGAGPDGIIGVAPAAEILSVSAWIGTQNPAGISIEEQIPAAVRWAVDNGAQVINMSLGSSSPAWPQSWDDAFRYAEQHDVVIVAAAGNRRVGIVQVGAPATIPGVLTVAGLSRAGEASWDSSSQGISIGVAAPAEELVGGLPGGLYADWSGTSAAAPLVSGVAALIRARYPEMSAAQVVNRIISTARDGGDPGKDPIYGYGILDASAALTAQVPVVEENPLGTMADWIRVHRRGSAAPPPESAPAPAPTEEPAIPEPTVPVAAEPAASGDVLPASIIFGFSGLILFVIAGGTYQTVRARRYALENPQEEEGETGSIPALKER